MKSNYSSELYDFCIGKSSLSVYGTGNIAHIIGKQLTDYRIHIKNFIISDNQEKKMNELYGTPVLYFSDWEQKSSNDAIIIAVSEQYWSDIDKNIKNKGITCDRYYVKRKDFCSDSIGILDTRISTENHGNEIIMESVDKQIYQLCKDKFVYRFPFLDNFEGYTRMYMGQCKYPFLGGTNALNSKMEEYKYIGINDNNISALANKIVLVGVGWEKYDELASEYTQYVLKKVLAKDVLHSVRDTYTKDKLQEIGICSVVNTGCCTLWNLDEKHCRKIPQKKAQDAIVMVTPKNREMDTKLIQAVKRNYGKVYFWAQGPADYWYIKSICSSAIAVSYQLNDLNKFLADRDIDYIGTRLHGGIKCLQHGKRSIIVSIDNRATEMGKDFNLPVWENNQIDYIDKIINGEIVTDIKIPICEIQRWKAQFI